MPKQIRKDPGLSDRLVRAGRPKKTEGRSVNMPIELGSTMVFDTMQAFLDARDRRHEGGTSYYGRYGNEATHALETALAELDGADGVKLTASGVSAITCSLMAVAGAGDHVLVADNIYGNTRAFAETVLARQGVEVDFFDPMIGPGVADLFKPTTRALMFEAPGSITFEVPDIPVIAAACRKAGVVSILDATWPTPVFCRPLDLGVDVVVTSGSKYLNGHSDAMIGTIATNEPLLDTIRKTVHAVGDRPGSQEVFLSLRGLRTLELRMAAVDRAGRAVADWFQDRPECLRLLHPAFESCPGHMFWSRDFTGAAGLFAVLLDASSEMHAHRFVNALAHFGIGVSWGGYESLALPMVPTRTASTWSEPGHLVRFNIGLEDVDTLIADIEAALPVLKEA